MAGNPLFATPPGCLLLHQASFITGLGDFKTKAAGTDYNFFPFPDINPQFTGAVEGAGDLFGMFHDTPAAKSLMAYLVTAPAQDIWVKHGGALSANKNATDYPDDISKRSAALLQNAKIFAFDASDLMPSAMNSAFWQGRDRLLEGPVQLDAILADLDKHPGGRLRPVAASSSAWRAATRPSAPPATPFGGGTWIRLLLMAWSSCIGVPAVLIGYICAHRACSCDLSGAHPAADPAVAVAGAGLAFLFVFLVYPTIGTIIRSFQNKAGTAFIGLDNYAWFFTNPTRADLAHATASSGWSS